MMEVLMFKGVLRFLGGSKFKAFLIFRECWKTYRKYEQIYLKVTEKENKCSFPEYMDQDFLSRLFLGLGLFYLGISALPKSLSTISRIVGFSGNRDKGKAYLEKCMAQRKCRAGYSALILCLYYLDREPNLDKVCQILNTFIKAYPHSSLFYWVASIISWKHAQLDDAVFFIDRALMNCPIELAKKAAFLKYEVGWFHYLKMEYESALIKFKEVLHDCLDVPIEKDEELEDLNSKTLISHSDHNGGNEVVHKDLVKKFNINNQYIHYDSP
mmetsp:Transcript_15109/g.14689  ORF Transcript_15109/g.14689 Transcript_15109/m.14689 type:complete len:270 (+) Transcript_15109:1740-2549(+)